MGKLEGCFFLYTGLEYIVSHINRRSRHSTSKTQTNRTKSWTHVSHSPCNKVCSFCTGLDGGWLSWDFSGQLAHTLCFFLQTPHGFVERWPVVYLDDKTEQVSLVAKLQT